MKFTTAKVFPHWLQLRFMIGNTNVSFVKLTYALLCKSCNFLNVCKVMQVLFLGILVAVKNRILTKEKLRKSVVISHKELYFYTCTALLKKKSIS